MDDQNRIRNDTEMTAQRRHRRRTPGPETEEIRRTGTTTADTTKETTPDPGTGDVRKTEAAVTDMSGQAKPGPETEDTRKTGAAAADAAGEVVSDPKTEDTRRIGLSATGTTAEAAATGESLQRADSRVPAEARRMAEAPYGAARPEHRRPGTRPMVAPARPAIPAKPTKPAGRPEGKALARELRHQAVGYAPGRMKEGFTRQIPAQTEARGNTDNGSARAYLERRGQPFSDRDREEPPAKAASRMLKLTVWALLILGAVLTVLLVLQNQSRTDDRKPQADERVILFEDPKPEGQVVSTDVVYSVVTTKDVKEIRLTDRNGAPVPISLKGVDNLDGNAWLITLNMEEDFQGTLRLEIRGEDEEWQPTKYRTSKLAVLGVPAPTQGPETDEDGDEDGGEQPEVTLVPEAGEQVTPAPEETAATEPEEDGTAGEPEEESEGETEKKTPEEDLPEDAGEDEEEKETAEVQEDNGIQDSDEAGAGDFAQAGALRTVVPTDTPKPEMVEKPTATPPLTVEAAPEANPDLITNVTVYVGSRKQKDYNRPNKELIHMPEASQYTPEKMGVLTFRGDNFRRNAAAGTLNDEATGLAVKWYVESGSSRGVNQTYYGYGWPGQPAISKWSKQVRAASNLYESKQEKAMLKEVIIAGLDGAIRFLDLDDGSLTRNSIKLTYPMTATPSLHTVGQPYMTVGQFARKMKVKTGRIGLRQYNLYNQKELKLIDGLDTKHRRPLNNIGSFETSALIDRNSDTLITAGSNGMLYLEALNSAFDYKVGVMNVSLSETTMTSKAKGQKNTALTAIESSLAAYDKYVYYADMGGVLRCVDTDTLRPVWAVATGDAVMAAVAMDLTENRELNLYTANMYANRKKGNGKIQIRRYDALSGREAWCTDIGVYKGKKDKADVGAKASPVIGDGKLKDLVYFTVTGLSEEGRAQLNLSGEEKAALIALDKATGEIRWAMGMESRTESSPVAVYDEKGNGWIIQCAENGNIYMVEGLTGRETATLKLEAEIVASPAVYNETMVIGTTGKGTSFVYGIEIKTATPREMPDAADAKETTAPEGGQHEEAVDEDLYEEEDDDPGEGEGVGKDMTGEEGAEDY